MDEPVCQPGMR